MHMLRMCVPVFGKRSGATVPTITNTSNSTIKPKGDAQYSERKPTTKTMLFTGTCLA